MGQSFEAVVRMYESYRVRSHSLPTSPFSEWREPWWTENLDIPLISLLPYQPNIGPNLGNTCMGLSNDSNSIYYIQMLHVVAKLSQTLSFIHQLTFNRQKLIQILLKIDRMKRLLQLLPRKNSLGLAEQASYVTERRRKSQMRRKTSLAQQSLFLYSLLFSSPLPSSYF